MIPMKISSGLTRLFTKKRHPAEAGSRFEGINLGGGRFECTLSSVSHSGECADLFLDVYSPDALRGILDRAGIIGHLKGKGISDPLIETEKDEAGVHRLRVYRDRPSPKSLLIDLRLSRLVYAPEERLLSGVIRERRFNAIAIEWVCFQDPRARFSAERPRLPGQTYPGLGAVRFLAPLLLLFAQELGVDAVLDVPERYHSAVMYSKHFMFIDPEREGMLRAAIRDLGAFPLAEVSRAFESGRVRDARTGAPIAYEPSVQVLPFGNELTRYFSSRKYRNKAEAAAQNNMLVLGRRAEREKKKRTG